jgi:hypothetical protein
MPNKLRNANRSRPAISSTEAGCSSQSIWRSPPRAGVVSSALIQLGALYWRQSEVEEGEVTGSNRCARPEPISGVPYGRP